MNPARKIVINTCFGGFGLSKQAVQEYCELANVSMDDMRYRTRDIERDDPVLIAIVERLGELANGMFSKLAIVQIPADVEWTIEEYDGVEHVAETHKVWGADMQYHFRN